MNVGTTNSKVAAAGRPKLRELETMVSVCLWLTNFFANVAKADENTVLYLDENRRVAGLSFACFDQGKPPTDTSAFVTWNIVVGFSNKYTIHI